MSESTDVIAQFKENQKQAWSSFAPLEMMTSTAAPYLLRFAGVRPNDRLLDVGCGTGVVALTAARDFGAKVTGLDLTPALLERAHENAALVGKVDVAWLQGDAEALPFESETFDVVVSQFGHMFAPRPEVAVGEMLRVLRPGGTIAFSTWPPELFTGQMFAVVGRYSGPPPAGVAPPPQWGDVALVRQRLGAQVKNVTFDRAAMRFPSLSPGHTRAFMEQTAGPMIRLVKTLEASDPQKLAQFRAELEALIAVYFENNTVRQDFLITRATKA